MTLIMNSMCKYHLNSMWKYLDWRWIKPHEGSNASVYSSHYSIVSVLPVQHILLLSSFSSLPLLKAGDLSESSTVISFFLLKWAYDGLKMLQTAVNTDVSVLSYWSVLLLVWLTGLTPGNINSTCPLRGFLPWRANLLYFLVDRHFHLPGGF